ncbi:hypothetical protein ACFY0G_01970 [Streptomyces sp. NPDC001552]|uniref:hypothetical protein n=1 Tax=Streptomyces sp. NPDC001552 TaxID=3364587 RepID=UPI003690DB9C
MTATREQLLAMVLAAPGGIEALLRQYDLDEMTAMLRCTPSYAERALRQVVGCQKIGEKVRFDIVDFLLARELHRIAPVTAPQQDDEAASAPAAAITEARSYKRLQPAGASRRR